MKKKHQIVIAEDHTILREGLCALLRTNPDFEIIGEAEDGRKAISCVEKLSPDLILMDLSMPRMDGLTAIREIKKQNPGIKIIALTVHKTEEYVLQTLQAGVDGYILKDASSTELVLAIRKVLAGNHYLSADISGKVIKGYLEGKKDLSATSSWGTLTEREKEILKLIAEGYKNREISEYLNISVKTTEKHRSNLMGKLGIHNAAALTAYAVDKGIVIK